MMKVDIYAHIVPPKYKEFVAKLPHTGLAPLDYAYIIPHIHDLEARFRVMDRFPDVLQMLTIAAHIPSDLLDPNEALELSMRLNDEMAELVNKYPDRFAGAVAAVPLNDIDAALRELERAICELHLRGLLIRVPINDRGPDAPEFMPLYEAMCHYNLPIWIHPQKRRDVPDYASENTGSKYGIWHVWGIIYETTVAMTRLVFSGVMQKYPNLKVITHHCGAMVPYFCGRINDHYDLHEMHHSPEHDFKRGLAEKPPEYFRRFYNDTVTNGNTSALMCAYEFFGADRLLFGTDAPYDAQGGAIMTRNIIEAVERMAIPDADKRKIFVENARKICRLPL